MYGNPPQVVSLTKCDPQFFYSKILQNWQNTDCNDKNICVAGFNYNSLVAVCCSVFWMQEDACICFLVIAVSKSFKTYWLIANNTLFFSDYTCIIRTSGHIFTILSPRKLNSSVLLLLSLKKLRQFCGIFPLSVTLRLAPMPRFDRVSAYKLEDQYTSNTISVLV